MSNPSPRVVSRHAEVCAVLRDPGYVVPPAPAAAPETVDWLRATVSRFCNDAEHERRRAIVLAEVARLDAAMLRAAAGARTAAALRGAGPDPFDLMPLARAIPLAVLAGALGAAEPDAVARDVVAVAGAYAPGGAPSAEADAAVARLLRALGPGEAEVVANRIGLLVQGCDATAALIGNATEVGLLLPRGCVERWPVEAIVAETLRHRSPVRATRRERAGDPGAVVLDLAAANRDPAVFDDPHRFDPDRPDRGHVTFGHGPRRCPGDAQAVALACGVVEAALAATTLAEPDVPLLPSPNLRLPARLLVTVC